MRKIQIFFQPPQALIDCLPDVSLLHVLGPGNLSHGPPQDETGVDAPGLTVAVPFNEKAENRIFSLRVIGSASVRLAL